MQSLFTLDDFAFRHRIHRILNAQDIDRLAQQYGPTLVLYARQWCRHPDDALQNALVDLLQLTRDPDDPAAWLFTTVRRKAQNIARTERRLKTHHDAARQSHDAWFEADVDRNIIAAEIQQALQKLSDIERQIVVARIWGELNFEQIAMIVATSSSTAHRKYQHALAILGQTLNADIHRNLG